MAIEFRNPTVEDGAALWRFVRDNEVLDDNSSYAYLMLCRYFGETCLVAELEGELVGFVVGFIPPGDPEAVFVWQIGVSEKARGQGLGKQLLQRLLDSPACRNVRYLEATVTPSNLASRRLFESVGKARNAPFCWHAEFAREHFPAEGEHEPEDRVRIGPWR